MVSIKFLSATIYRNPMLYMKLKFVTFRSSWDAHSFFAKVKYLRFWPKTMDYIVRDFDSSFFVVLLLQ